MNVRMIPLLIILTFFVSLCGCAASNTLALTEFKVETKSAVSSTDVFPETTIDSLQELTSTEIEAETETEIQDRTTEYSTNSIEPEIDKELVMDIFHEDGEFLDGTKLSFRIPAVQIDSEEISHSNDELYDVVYPEIEQALTASEREELPNISFSSYEWAVNDDILSLHYWAESYFTCYNYHIIRNYSISRGKELTKTDVLNTVGWSVSDFNEKCRQVLITELINWTNPDNQQFEYTIDWMWFEAYESTLSDDNIEDAIPFLNDKGHLCILGYGYTMYEGGYDSFIIDLEEYEVSAYYRDDYQIGDTISFTG